ncbi:unnamed protein product [Penicillium crustosum]
MRPFSRDEFAIAIICALTLEAEAVEELFDETYDRFGALYKKQPGDDNAYINGRVGDHNVVLCYMPGMGKGNAASVASSMKISYKRIQVALVVGICGGAPFPLSGREIFLGDVIISDAVIEYDFGRQYAGGFERKTGVKDTLGRPNREIRSKLAGLKAKRSLIDLQAKMLRHMQAIQKSQPDWHHPSSADDVLFEASYQHKHHDITASPKCCCFAATPDEICKEALDTSCTHLGCDKDHIRRRRHGTENYNPVIHIGTVASADTVMKSGEHRDRLIKSEHVIGFEMEGAGIWDNISCIIIKGVCDYADSHKNKEWQAYAAATGAATAKAFLEYWEPMVVEDNLAAVPAIEDFVGREDDLKCLWDNLQPARSRTRKVAVLHGLGGIGKTQLAIRFARMHQDDFTAIFWLSGRYRSELVSGLSSCLPRIQNQHVDDEAISEVEAEQRAQQVLRWLAMPGNTRWLIVFDNIDQYSSLPNDNDQGYDICEFFPKVDHGSIIITSRLQRFIEVGKSFPVQKLTQSDAMHLLRQSSGILAQDNAPVDTEQDVTALTNHLDGLSLAIVLAGAFMRQTGTSIKEYLQFYKEDWSNLQSESEPTRHYRQGNILQTWMITYHEMKKRWPNSAKLLMLLAQFDNQDIWYELIRNGCHKSDAPLWLEEIASNPSSFRGSVKILLEFSLLESKRQGSYTMHPVVQDWCVHVSGTDEDMISLQLSEIALISVGYTVPTAEERDYDQLQRRLLPQCNYVAHRQYINKSIWLWGGFHGLGLLYRNLGKLKEAEKMYQRALAGYEEALGPDHTSTLNTVQNLGLLYSDQGKLKEAEEMYQRALVGYEVALGPDHQSTLSTVHNLGLLYSNQGKLKEAEEMCQRALVGYEDALGPDHPSTLNTVQNLGLLYSDQGKLKEAEEMYQRALAGYEEALGPDHPSTLSTVHNLGVLYYKQGKPKEAEEMYQRALAGYEEALGPDHPSTLSTVHNLGLLYYKQGKPKVAEEMCQRALTGREKALGPDHPSTLGTVHNLGVLYSDQGKLKEAEEMYQRALAGYKEALGPDHPSTLNTVHNLGVLYSDQGKLKEAERMYQRTAGKGKVLGPNPSAFRRFLRRINCSSVAP